MLENYPYATIRMQNCTEVSKTASFRGKSHLNTRVLSQKLFKKKKSCENFYHPLGRPGLRHPCFFNKNKILKNSP